MPSLAATNVTDDTYLEYFREAEKAFQDVEATQREHRAAVGAYRAILKRAKKAGVQTAAISFTLAARRMDPDELKMAEQAKARMMALSGVWPTIDQDLFENFTSTRETAEKEAEIITRDRAYDDGYFAGNEGKDRKINPHFQGTMQCQAWDEGWIKGQAKIIRQMAPKKAGRPPAPKKGDLPAADAGAGAPLN